MSKKVSAGQAKVARIISDRDNISITEAEDMVIECVEEMEIAISNGDYEEAEDILADMLGLEMDYVFDLLL